MIWIIGAGGIAQEYAKVLQAMNREFLMVGRGETNARVAREALHCNVVSGGLDHYLQSLPPVPQAAIVAVNLECLAPVCLSLMEYGVKSILCEKPGFLFPEECGAACEAAARHGARVFLAYNRRCFASVQEAQRIIREDGGLKSFNFEFTEWGHVIMRDPRPESHFQNWFYANSSHVADLAFFLGGTPVQMSSYVSGELPWHKPAVFAGSGITDKGALFSYQANWAAPGRWGVELLTSKHRLYLRPMESLQIQNLGSVAVQPVDIDDHLDKEFKPGFYLETQRFLDGDFESLCSIQDQQSHLAVYNKILGRS